MRKTSKEDFNGGWTKHFWFVYGVVFGVMFFVFLTALVLSLFFIPGFWGWVAAGLCAFAACKTFVGILKSVVMAEKESANDEFVCGGDI